MPRFHLNCQNDLTASDLLFSKTVSKRRKAVSLSVRIVRLTAGSGLSVNPENGATCLCIVYCNRSKRVCQPFSTENDLFLIIFFEKFQRDGVRSAETINIVRAA